MGIDDFRTRHVFGWNGPGRSPVDNATTPLPGDAAVGMRSMQIARLSNKLILADCVWHGDRFYSDPRTRWHDDERRRFNTLFADGRVELFYFDPAEIETDKAPANYQLPSDRSFIWW